MNQETFVETIKIFDGQIFNLLLHQHRMESTMSQHFLVDKFPQLSNAIVIPTQYQQGLVKCRVLYSSDLLSVEFEEYKFKKLNTLRLVVANDIDYQYKSMDRVQLNLLARNLQEGEEVLIVRNGLITDTSFTNVVFENSEGLFTPSTPLLRGTKRELLLQKGIIKEREIGLADIKLFSKVYLINALIDLDDDLIVDISKIF